MRILISPLIGRKQVGDQSIDVDVGIDQIRIDSREYESPRLVGFVGRFEGAPINLIAPVPESTLAKIRKAVAQRDDDADVDRKVSVPPPMLEEESESGDD